MTPKPCTPFGQKQFTPFADHDIEIEMKEPIFKATKYANNWRIVQCENPAVFVQHNSLPVAIAEMKRLSGLDEITIKF